jgi:hypothetical protein
MPRGPRGEKRPADVIGNAIHVMRIATREVLPGQLLTLPQRPASQWSVVAAAGLTIPSLYPVRNAVAPSLPHLVHRIRGPKDGAGTSSGHLILDRRPNQIDTAMEQVAKRGRTNAALSAIEGERKARASLADERNRGGR